MGSPDIKHATSMEDDGARAAADRTQQTHLKKEEEETKTRTSTSAPTSLTSSLSALSSSESTSPPISYSLTEQNRPGRSKKLQATPEMCYHCFATLIETLSRSQYQQRPKTHKQQSTLLLVPAFVHQLPNATVESPIFVTWEITTTSPLPTTTSSSPSSSPSSSSSSSSLVWKLRGCIGTLSPRVLATAVGEYAIMSSLRDRRFRPITKHEVPLLRCSVSLLVDYETCPHVYDWTVGTHGILIKFEVDGDGQTLLEATTQEQKHHYSATYLPEVASQQKWDQTKTVASLIQKAGYHGQVTPELLQSIHCTRYQSSKCQVTFEEYVKEQCHGENPISEIEEVALMLSSSSNSSRNQSPCIIA